MHCMVIISYYDNPLGILGINRKFSTSRSIRSYRSINRLQNRKCVESERVIGATHSDTVYASILCFILNAN